MPAGELLRRELEARGWSQGDFAAVLDRPAQFVCEVVTGRKEITRESAAQIAAALGDTAEYWLTCQHRYLLAEQSRNTQVKLDEVRRRARLYDKAPIRLLTRRGLLTGVTLDALEVEVKEWLETVRQAAARHAVPLTDEARVDGVHQSSKVSRASVSRR